MKSRITRKKMAKPAHNEGGGSFDTRLMRFLALILASVSLLGMVASYGESKGRSDEIRRELTTRIDAIELDVRGKETLRQNDHDLLNTVRINVEWLVKQQGGEPRGTKP